MNVINKGNNQRIIRQQVIRTVKSMTVGAGSGEREYNNDTVPVKFSRSSRLALEETAEKCRMARGELVRTLVEMCLIFAENAERAGIGLPDYMSDAAMVYDQFLELRNKTDNVILQGIAGIRKK